MSDPLATVLGTQVIVEGIKFLYGQATEALKRLYDKRENPSMPSEIASVNAVPNIFVEKPQMPVIQLDVVEKLEGELDEVSSHLTRYAEGIRKVDLNNVDLLNHLDTLRRLLEQVYNHRLTFEGEIRETNGESYIIQQLNIGVHSGEAIGVEIEDGAINQSVNQQTNINEITALGKATGIKITRATENKP